MALKKIVIVEGKSIIQTSFGDVKNGDAQATFLAYIKVTDIFGGKSKIIAKVSFSGDTQSFEKQYQLPVSVEDGSPNFIAQTYAYLKTLPEFAGAEDC
jgi:hypothetical protein